MKKRRKGEPHGTREREDMGSVSLSYLTLFDH
jgi:hypothetical protein